MLPCTLDILLAVPILLHFCDEKESVDVSGDEKKGVIDGYSVTVRKSYMNVNLDIIRHEHQPTPTWMIFIVEG